MNQEQDINRMNAMIQALDNTGVCMFMYYPQTKTITVPKNTCETYRCNDFYENMPHSFADDFVHEEDYDTFKEAYYRIDRGEKTVTTTFHSKDLNYCTHVTLTTLSWTSDGQPQDVFGLIENWSDLYKNQRLVGKLQEELAVHYKNDELDQALKTMATSIGSQYFAVYYIWLESHTYVCFHEQLQGILEIIGEKGQYESAWNTYINNFIEEKDREGVRKFFDINTLAERIGIKNSISYTYQRKEVGWSRGQYIVGERDQDGKPLTLIFTVSDINDEIETKLLKHKAEQEALHDPLTNLWNRKAFDQFKESEEYKYNRTGLVLFDIDRFKGINDQYGHDIGDQVIVAVANEVRNALRQKDLVFRMGGDEFAILLYDCNPSMWKTFCRKLEMIHSNLKENLALNLNITLSAGICVNKQGYCDEMYNLTDQAMYNTKQNGRAGCTGIQINGELTHEWHDTNSFLRKGEILEKNSTVTWRLDQPKKEGLKTKIYGDELFCAFVGLKPSATPEELYEAWKSRVRADHLDIINEAAKRAVTDGKVEVVFQWNHPEKGWIQLRCSAFYEAETEDYDTFIGYIHVITGTHVVTMEDIDARVKNALEKLFFCNFYIRLKDYSFKVYKAQPYMLDLLGKSENAVDAVRDYIAYMVADESKEEMKAFLDLDTIKQRLEGRDSLENFYHDPNIGLARVTFIVIDRDDTGEPETVALVVDPVEQRLLTAHNTEVSADELLQMQKEAIARLTNSELIFISIIDKETGASRVIQAKHKINKDRIFDLDYAMQREAANLLPTEQKDFLEKTSLAMINKHLETNDHYVITVFLRLPNAGRFRRVSYQFSRNAKFPNYILATTEDITDSFVRDKVTGLKNFDGFRMDCMYEFSHAEQKQFIIINFNIVNFKAVNAMYGYESGDWLLKKVLEALEKAEIPFCSVCRENADNFFCLCRKEDFDYEILNKLCKMKVRADNGLTENTELFCGVYFINNNGEAFDTVCDKARIARRHAEREIGVNVYVLDEEDKQQYLNEAVILSSVSQAIHNKEMIVYYQPIFDAQTGTLASAEALVRWQHPERGMIPPNLFIPAIERTGQIAAIDMYVGQYVHQFQKDRFMSGKKIIPISINVSRYDFLDEKFLKHALTIMNDNQSLADMIRIEITESGLINIPSSGEAFMNEMRRLGVQMMIDDFGTGYSSLSSLVDRPCDTIKLDMTFARRIGIEKKMEILIKAAIETAHYLNVKVVAEGVETKEQFEFLRDNGCDYIQGYYFSKPLPQEEFEMLLDGKL